MTDNNVTLTPNLNATLTPNLVPILPGQTLGVMGGGQLGRMFVHAAQRLGYRTVVLDADAQSPAGRVSHGHIRTAYGDAHGLAELAASASAVTTEFENVPANSLQALEASVPVRPSAAAVAVCQDRALEKAYFLKANVACAPHASITSLADCGSFALGLLPGILKTAQMGYDGKGQITVHDLAGLQQAFSALGGVRCLLEKRLDLDYEVSVIVARGADGACVHLPAQQNLHRNGILAVSIIPAIKLPVVSAQYAYAAAIKIANSLNYVGVLCVEFFVLQDGSLVANELAPRPHNSGHYSIEACDVSQYELQVRTLAGLPLVQPQLREPAVMLNLLGDLWFCDAQATNPVEPDWPGILRVPGAALHLYGKTEPKRGRKMGHITVTASTAELARQQALICCALLGLEAF